MRFPGGFLKPRQQVFQIPAQDLIFRAEIFSRQDITHLDLDFRVCSQTQSIFPVRFQNMGGKFSGLEIPGCLPGKSVLPMR